MRNRSTFLAAALVIMVVGTTGARQERRAPRSIRLEFPGTSNLAGLSIRYFLTGPFGGFGGFVRTQPDVRVYDVEVWQAGQAARTLKAIIYCPGRRIALVSESEFGDGAPKTLSVRLEPLGSVPLAGRIIGAGARPLQIEVTYLAFWGHDFFGIADGAVASFDVASTPLRPDGSFVVSVPDLAQDPVVARYGEAERGSFQFIAREPETGNIAFFLENKNSPSPQIGLPIATAYSGEVQFVIRRR